MSLIFYYYYLLKYLSLSLAFGLITYYTAGMDEIVNSDVGGGEEEGTFLYYVMHFSQHRTSLMTNLVLECVCFRVCVRVYTYVCVCVCVPIMTT